MSAHGSVRTMMNVHERSRSSAPKFLARPEVSRAASQLVLRLWPRHRRLNLDLRSNAP